VFVNGSTFVRARRWHTVKGEDSLYPIIQLNGANNVRQTAIHTAYPLVSQCSYLISN